MSWMIYVFAGAFGLAGLVTISLLVRAIIREDYSSLVGDIVPRQVGSVMARFAGMSHRANQLAVAHFVPNPLETDDPAKISIVAAGLEQLLKRHHSTDN